MKLICAPMATLSHEAFRVLIERFGGCDEYYTEMIHAPSLLTGGQFEKYYLLNGPVPEKIVWQLTGPTAEPLAKACAVVAKLGGIGVDINMGCCAPEIYKSGAGIAWMLKPVDETRSMVQGVKQALQDYTAGDGRPMRLSVKLRLGDEDYTDAAFFSFTDMLVECGVMQLTLHARTRKEKYRGNPRWKYVSQLKDRYKKHGVTIILNGAVHDIASAQNAIATAPESDGIMIARAAVQKPWIFSELAATLDGGQKKDCSIDLLQLGLDYLDALQLYQPPEFWKSRSQRFFAYYCNNFSFAHYAQTQMLNAKDMDDARSRLSAYFDKVPEDRYKKVCLLANSNA
ncbi:MAG: tRNA-dihydrouridine synthase family protein [Treponema sp.]|nr:tRNA-dihydrouridine synthase family protein [Treponema sp.]